jgi:hypothetical protein
VRIHEDTSSKVFTGSLSSYKRKDDLIVLAGALGLSTTGTIPELMAKIKAHIEDHPELTQNPRFSGLFQRGRRVRGEDLAADNSATTTVVPTAPTTA